MNYFTLDDDDYYYDADDDDNDGDVEDANKI